MPEPDALLVLNACRPRWLHRLRVRWRAWRFAQAGAAALNRLWLSLAGAPAPGVYPAEILIETATRCNAHCAFCPVNVRADPRPATTMSDALLDRILDELRAADYAGEVNFFLHNEPLLDRRLEAICGRFRRALPRAALVVFTNGRLLTTVRYRALMASGIDLLCVNDYGDRGTLSPRLRAWQDGLAGEDWPGRDAHLARTLVRVRLDDERLGNRAGQAPNRLGEAPHPALARAGCLKPFEQFAIRASGEVSQCCNDALGASTLGNVNRQSIAEVWNGDGFRALRERLVRQGRASDSLCRGCDAEKIPVPNALKRRAALGLIRVRRSLGARRVRGVPRSRPSPPVS